MSVITKTVQNHTVTIIGPHPDKLLDDLIADAECFRFWVREAAQSPGDMAKLIAKCVTEQEYRDAILPIATAASRVISTAKGEKP